MSSVSGDRRHSDRVPLHRPCKIYEPRSRKYLGGVTRDFSEGGMLVELPRVLELKPGDTLHVGVAMKRRQALLPSSEMVQVEVRRLVHTADDRTLLGLRLAHPVDTSVTALRLAA
jgi:c-di-GMP-binding flagellar brake protein YcgR